MIYAMPFDRALKYLFAFSGVLPPSLITRSSSTTSNMNEDSDGSLQSLDDDIDAPSASHAPHALAASFLMNQVVSPSEPKSSFVRRHGGSRVVLPSIDALLSARGDGLQHVREHGNTKHESNQQMHPSIDNHGREHYSSSYFQEEQEQRYIPQPQLHHQHSQEHPQPELAMLSLPSRHSLRVISSSHAEMSRENISHLHDTAVQPTSQAVSHIPRPSTSVSTVTAAAKDAPVPDGRFEFVGASIADGRRKQLARPATAVSIFWPSVHSFVFSAIRDFTAQHPSRPGRRQHAAVAHLFDAKQAGTGQLTIIHFTKYCSLSCHSHLFSQPQNVATGLPVAASTAK